MSLTIQQIILDAKRLAGRLKERETEADALLTETQTAYRQIHTMKQVGNLDASKVDHFVLNLGETRSYLATTLTSLRNEC